MKQPYQNDDNDFQKLLLRLGLIAILAFFGFGLIKFMEKIPKKEPKIQSTSNIYSDTINVRTNDAVMSTIIVNYVFDQPQTEEFYKQNIHYPISEALQTNAFKMNWNQPEILNDFQTMANETVRENLIHTVWKDVVITINHEPRVLKLLENRNQEAKNEN